MGGFTYFDDLVLRSTPLEYFLAWLKFTHYKMTLYQSSILGALDRLHIPAGYNRPTFVFAHITIPHPPFIFVPRGKKSDCPSISIADGSHRIKGSEQRRQIYIKEYREQLQYVNLRIIKILDHIKATSTRPLMIVLQGDHGPGSTLNWDQIEKTYFLERLGILNAFHFPDGHTNGVYDTISPVNTFRLILNKLFATSLPILEDVSFMSNWLNPYLFVRDTHGTATADLNGFTPRVMLAHTKLGEPKKEGSPLDAEGNLKIMAVGVEIVFEKLLRGKLLKISLDGNDDYRLEFLLGKESIGVVKIKGKSKNSGLRNYVVNVPELVTVRGFDGLKIYPSGGDLEYAVGYIKSTGARHMPPYIKRGVTQPPG